MGSDLEVAKTLARQYEKHAFVWSGSYGPQQLVQP